MEHFRAGLGDYLDRVFFLNESFLVTRNRNPYVRIDPASPDIKPYSQINALEIRKESARVLGLAHYLNTSLLVLRRGKPVAVISGVNMTKESHS